MLQKKIKLFGSLLILTGSSLILALTITSCGVVESSKPDEYSEYINDRTFSIGVNTDSESSSLGTAWIFQKKYSIQTNYEYYLATNLHVSIPFNPLNPYSPLMFLGYNNNYKINTSLALDGKYFALPKNDTPTIIGWKLLGIDSDTRPKWATFTDYEWDVDFNVFDVNFGDESNIKAYDPYHTSNSWPLLERLKKLNAVAAGTSNGKTITPFAGSDYEIKDKNLHVGGFPKRPANTNTGEPKWTYYSTKCANTEFTCTLNYPNMSLQDEDGTWKTMPDGKRIYILGKQIGFTKKGTQALTGGSSGSLVINDEKQAVAINYAGNIANNKKNSIENFALMLNCDSPYYNGSDDASNYRYNILSRFFPML